jgi:hypothetical protein
MGGTLSSVGELEGNPSEKGAVTLRLRFPADYNILPHWHSVTERATVLSGALQVGMGDRLDRQASQTIEPGGFVSLSRRRCTTSHGRRRRPSFRSIARGSFDIFYVNPADSPVSRQTKRQGPAAQTPAFRRLFFLEGASS